MVDPRIYRTTLVIVLAALIVFGFSFTDQPGSAGTTLAPVSMSNSVPVMKTLFGDYPVRSPGSPADQALATYVANELAAKEQGTAQYAVTTQSYRAQTADGPRTLEEVIGTRAGPQAGTIVIVSDRDEPGEAGLSGTAVMLQLANVLAGEDQNRSLMLVSTTGSIGAAGTTELARSLAGQQVDAVIVLGDLAGAHVTEPLIIPWSDGPQLAPPLLRNTLAVSVQSLADLRAGDSGIGPQIAHLALPFSATEQGPFGEQGIPAVLLSTSGNRDSSAGEPIDAAGVAALGQAVLQTVNALNTGPAVPAPSAYLIISGKLVPEWAFSLLVLALILPVLAATIDGIARARRRGHSIIRWVLWVLAGAVPFVVGFMLVELIRLAGWLPATPPGPVGAGGVALSAKGIAALASILVVIVAAFAWLRPLCIRLASRIGPRTPERTPGDGAAIGLALVMCLTTLLIWARDPFAAALVLPALHLWLWLRADPVRGHRAVQIAMALAGLLAPLLVVLYYAHSLGLSLVDLPWNGLLLLTGGQVGLLAVAYWSVLLGCVASAVVIMVRSAPERQHGEPVVTTRGPITYAGPGSLGGTGSALRR